MKTFILTSLLIVFFNFSLVFSQYYDYKADWKKVDSIAHLGLPKTALDAVEKIYNKAVAEKNTPQLIKAVIYKMKYNSAFGDNAFVKNIESTEKRCADARFPEKPILHSMLAEMYWWYYQNNRHKFYNRSTTNNFMASDIGTWDLNRIISTVIGHYKASLDSCDKLKQIGINSYKEILTHCDSNDRLVRPTLYDFLVHRAIDFFKNDEAGLVRPVNEFSINDEKFFLPAGSFTHLSIHTQDSMSFKYNAIILFQDAIRFHLNDMSPEALADVDLKRIEFVYENSTSPIKDSLYLNSLYSLKNKYFENELSYEIDLLIAQKLFDIGNIYNPRVSELHKWDKKKAYDICLQKTGDNYFQSLLNTIEQKEVKITIEKENLPNEPFRALVEYKNTDTIFFRAIKTTYNELEEIKKAYNDSIKEREQKKYYVYINQNDFAINYFRKKKPYAQFREVLPNDGDFQEHLTEVKIPAFEKGLYFIMAGIDSEMDYNKNVVNFGITAITGISYISRNNADGSNDFYVLDRKTGAPLSGVKAECWVIKYNQITSNNESNLEKIYFSDSSGFFSIPFHGDYNNRNYYLNFIYHDDFWSTNNNDLWNNDGSFYNYRNYNKHTFQTKTFFFTDRSIYRPGQTIYFKGIIIETDGYKKNQIKTKYSTAVKLMDVNWQQAAVLNLTTNEFGTFSGSFTAPAKGLNGRMTIQDEFGSISISVEDYKRPLFEVKFDTLRNVYKLGEKITIKGHALAYSGANIDNAKVAYRVTREARFPWWCNYWWMPLPSSPEKEISNGTSNTNENGEFEISFKAIPDENISAATNPVFTFKVHVDITDINGETHGNDEEINVGYKTLIIKNDIPARFAKGGNEIFNISTENLKGDFVPASGNITIEKLQSPAKIFRDRKWTKPDKFAMNKVDFEKAFPNDVYNDENNPSTWPVEAIVMKSKFNTATDKSLQLEKPAKWKNGMYKLTMYSKDSYGEKVEETSYFVVFDIKNNQLPYAMSDWNYISSSVGEPGENINIAIGSAYPDVHILYEVEADDKIIEKKWFNINNEQNLVAILLKEEHRGNIGVHWNFISNNRLYTHNETIHVPFTNKKLDISFETFRNKLQPGEKEQWKIRVKNKNGEKETAEMVAELYDESLDAFVPHKFDFSCYGYYMPSLFWSSNNCFAKYTLQNFSLNYTNNYYNRFYKNYYDLSWFNFGGFVSEVNYMLAEESNSIAFVTESRASSSAVLAFDSEKLYKEEKKKTQKPVDLTTVKARANLSETAFFYPQLQTDENGDVLINFTMPEALTRWKMLGFAHTKDLKYGFTENELVTQKELMVVPNAPRFFREGDTILFASKVTCLSNKDIAGTAQLMLFDALTMKPVDLEMQNVNAVQYFSISVDSKPGVESSKQKSKSINLSWKIIVPEGLQAVTYRVVAKAGDFSDGEEMSLPVLTNRMLVTETLPISLKGKQSKTFTLDKLAHHSSTTLRNHKLTLEYTSNPAWYAIQALPYLMEYPYECAEQIFSRFYANSLASHIANSSPRIKMVFDSWKNISPDALLSNLEKNQELKGLLLEETPWVLEAKNESQRKQRVALLFDMNKMSDELGAAFNKLRKMQSYNGGFSWFAGGPEDQYITQHIVCGMGKLDHLGAKNIRDNQQTWQTVKNAIRYSDDRITEDYNELKLLSEQQKVKLGDDHLGYTQIHYLYARSFFKDVPVNGRTKEALHYYLEQAKTYWLSKNLYMQGMIAIALKRDNDSKVPAAVIRSLKERAVTKDELGMYWNSEQGWFWYQAPIETQALMIEAFQEVAHDSIAIDEMKVWLLKQKQTQDWKTTKATVEACYALLLQGTNWLAENGQPDIQVGNITVEPSKIPDVKAEAGTGYFKTSWSGNDIRPEMGTVKIKKQSQGVSWGSLYWQYFEQLDKITPAETPLKINKQLFIEQNTSYGPAITPITDTTHLKPGDLIKVRIELHVDRDMEYVHMKDMRAAGFEPVNVLSQYKYQDGLSYYESTRDAATNFFFAWLPKGVHVFEYSLRVNQFGNFSNGVTTIQSMYAPEFTSHSEGIRVKVY